MAKIFIDTLNRQVSHSTGLSSPTSCWDGFSQWLVWWQSSAWLVRCCSVSGKDDGGAAMFVRAAICTADCCRSTHPTAKFPSLCAPSVSDCLWCSLSSPCLAYSWVLYPGAKVDWPCGLEWGRCSGRLSWWLPSLVSRSRSSMRHAHGVRSAPWELSPTG